MKISLSILLTLIAFRAEAREKNWLEDSPQKLCKDIIYDKPGCKDAEVDDCTATIFINKKTKVTFGNFGGSSCHVSFQLGELFSPSPKLKCETFVKLLQKENQSCRNCIEQSHWGCGG